VPQKSGGGEVRKTDNRPYFLLVITLLILLVSSEAYSDDAIVYLNYNSELVAIYGPKKERIVIDPQIDYFTVSPDARFVIAFRAGCLNDENCTAHIYDLANATMEAVFMPFGNWGLCWWAIDSSRIYVIRELRQKDRGPACKDEDQYGCAARAIVQLAGYDLLQKAFFVEKEFEPCSGRERLAQYNKENNYESPSAGDILSPDGKWKLSWGKEKIERDWVKPEVVLVSMSTGLEKNVWVDPRCDFCSAVRVSNHPWSKDSKQFVLTKIPGGIFRWTFRIGIETTVYSIDITSLKWTELDKGVDAYWFPNMPKSFQRIEYCDN
jgi:hypothetical protein